MSVRERQIRDLANTIALQAEAFKEAPKESLNARAKLMKNNIQTLLAWTESPGFRGITEMDPEFWME